MGIEKLYKKISLDDSVRMEEVEREQSSITDSSTDLCFGEDELKMIEMNQERIIHEEHSNVLEKLLSEMERQNKELFKRSRHEFLTLLEKPQTKKAAERMVSDAFNNQQLSETLNQLIEKLPETVSQHIEKESVWRDEGEMALYGKNETLRNEIVSRRRRSKLILEVIREDVMDADTWFTMLYEHRVSYLEKKKRVLEYIPEFKASFKKIILTAIQNGELPITEERLNKVLEIVKIDVGDEIYNAYDNEGGLYRDGTEVVYISSANLSIPNIEKSKLFHVYIHEMFHALSGKTILKNTTIIPPDDDYNYDTQTTEGGPITFETTGSQRVGLEIGNRIEKKGERTILVEQFKWLNEALTEALAKKYSGYDDSDYGGAYLAEQKLLTVLEEKYDIPHELFLQAYFEHYEPEARKTESGAIPRWKKLFAVLNEKMGTGTLVKLDKEIKEQGIQRVLQRFTQK